MTAILGYARVSTTGQELDAQLSALTAAGAERVFTDKLSGARTQRARGLAAMLDYGRRVVSSEKTTITAGRSP